MSMRRDEGWRSHHTVETNSGEVVVHEKAALSESGWKRESWVSPKTAPGAQPKAAHGPSEPQIRLNPNDRHASETVCLRRDEGWLKY